ncbi:MAG TPA: SDR family oxidoreductase [Xanthobacteraceae bacterium]|nr:SDR family oxidoreductase [Xanthobacteraceae bacterium]
MKAGLTGKTALVTGSSRGIGRGIALALAAAGCNTVLTGRDAAALAEVAAVAESKGVKAQVVALDLRAADAAATLIAAARDAFGSLDILVNNAGSTKRGDFFALSDADWQDGFALKFFAHVRLARAAWPLLKERSGSLVTIGGTSGRKPQASFTIGSSVNAACAAFTKALADLGKRDGVQVNCIHPSLVDTDRQGRRIEAEMKRTGQGEAAVRAEFCREAGITRFGTPQDVAALVCFMVSKNGSWLHGATIDLDGGEIPVL